MKKKNKELARQRKAAERKKKERNEKIKKFVMIGIPSVIVAVLCIWVIVVMIQEHQASASTEAVEATETVETTETSTVTDASTSDDDADTLSTDASLVVEDGDTVNIDYVGSIDGVEFSGGNTNGAGADLTIGSEMYIDDFEDQLIGHNVGETVDVTVTFPDDYGNEDLNGKEAVFVVTINGIYE